METFPLMLTGITGYWSASPVFLVFFVFRHAENAPLLKITLFPEISKPRSGRKGLYLSVPFHRIVLKREQEVYCTKGGPHSFGSS